jgi:hypothetical protein
VNEPRNWAWLIDDIGAAVTGARYYPESPIRDRIIELLVQASSLAMQEWQKARYPAPQREATR